MNATIATRKGDGLIELEQVLNHMLATADANPTNAPVQIVITIDISGARQLRDALTFARSNGVAVQ